MADLVRCDERNVHISGKPTIGALRNAGCEAARGEIIAHFDDDDFSHPDRVANQVRLLLSSPGYQVAGYRSMRFTDGKDWWRYNGSVRYALGTSLVYRREWWQAHHFPEVQIGEDNGFASQAAARGALVTAEAGEMQWATIHPENTSPRQLRGNQWVKL